MAAGTLERMLEEVRTLEPSDAAQAISDVRQDFAAEYVTLALTSELVGRAADLADLHGLRGYDAIQLATALDLQELCVANRRPLVLLVSADQELNAAAQAEGLVVENPNDHP